MNKIQEQIARFKSVDMIEVFKDSVRSTEKILLNHNKHQLLHGEATDGDLLGEFKDAEYAEGKAMAGSLAPDGAYDLSLYGDFQDGMNIQFNLLGDIEINSSDNKTKRLEGLVGEYGGSKGGDRIFGLTEENKNIYPTEVYPVLMKDLRNKLGY